MFEMLGSVSEMEETVNCYLEMLESSGQVSHEDRKSMLVSYVYFSGQFRDDHAEDYSLGADESELWQNGTTNLSLRRITCIERYLVEFAIVWMNRIIYPKLKNNLHVF